MVQNPFYKMGSQLGIKFNSKLITFMRKRKYIQVRLVPLPTSSKDNENSLKDLKKFVMVFPDYNGVTTRIDSYRLNGEIKCSP